MLTGSMNEFEDDQGSQTSQKEEPSISDQLKELYSKKIDEGFQVKDRATAIELRKMGQYELKLGDGWNAYAKKILQEVLEEKGIVVPDLKSSARIGTFRINLEKPPQDLASGQFAPTQTPPAPPQQPQIIWDERRRESYKKIMSKGFEFLSVIYIKLGIIQGEEPEPEKLTPKKFQDESKQFGVQVADYCYDHQINLPMWIELMSLIASGFMVFGMPVIRVLFFKTEKAKEDGEVLTDGKDAPEP